MSPSARTTRHLKWLHNLSHAIYRDGAVPRTRTAMPLPTSATASATASIRARVIGSSKSSYNAAKRRVVRST